VIFRVTISFGRGARSTTLPRGSIFNSKVNTAIFENLIPRPEEKKDIHRHTRFL